MNDKYYMNELIQEINKMKITQEETNQAFQKRMNDLVRQNESMKRVNEKMIAKIKDMKVALSDKKQNYIDDDDIYGYDPFEKRKKNIQKKRLNKYFNYNDDDYNNYNGKKNYSFNIRNDKFNDLNDLDYDFGNHNNGNNNYNGNNYKSIDYNYSGKYRNYFLGKKDKDVEEFNDLNKNIISNKNNGVVVTPLLFTENDSKYISDFKTYNSPQYTKNLNNNSNTTNITRSNTRKEDLFNLIRKNNDRLEKIKELEEKVCK